MVLARVGTDANTYFMFDVLSFVFTRLRRIQSAYVCGHKNSHHVPIHFKQCGVLGYVEVDGLCEGKQTLLADLVRLLEVMFEQKCISSLKWVDRPCFS